MNAKAPETDTTLNAMLDHACRSLKGEIRLMTIEEQLADLKARVERLERANGVE